MAGEKNFLAGQSSKLKCEPLRRIYLPKNVLLDVLSLRKCDEAIISDHKETVSVL